MGAGRHSLIDVICRPLSPRGRIIVMRTLVMALLLPLLVVVLLPLMWMILTSLRTKGTAFSLEILPKTELLYPRADLPPYPAPPDLSRTLYTGPDTVNPDPGRRLYVEYDDPGATSVVAIIRELDPETGRDWESRYPLTRAFTGVWYGIVQPSLVVPSRLTYLVNGESEVSDPRIADSDKGIELESGLNLHYSPSFLVVRNGGVARVSIRGPEEISGMALVMEDGGRMSLERKADGFFAAEFPESGFEQPFRIMVTRPLGVAVAEKYTLENFQAILFSKDFAFSHYFLNSLIVATAAGFLTVLICTLASYAFSVFNFHFREGLFYMLLASMLVPGMIYMVPQFSITLKLGLMNTYAGMVVPHIANVFGLFLLRQYMLQIPRDLFAAAEIDGANDLQIFRTIVLPVCLPIMVTLFLLVFVGQWSNFLWQLIINTGDSNVLTLPVGLQQFKGQNANEWEKIMAGACFSILPISILFLSLQRYFLQGLTAGAVKE